jgi:hypothetical protein
VAVGVGFMGRAFQGDREAGCGWVGLAVCYFRVVPAAEGFPMLNPKPFITRF